MIIILCFVLLQHITHSDDDTLSLKLCNQWEVGSDLAIETYLKQFHLTPFGQYIINSNITDYTWYLPQFLADYHLSKFKTNGASFIASSNRLYTSNYGSYSYIGHNQQIVTTIPEMHNVLINCSNKSNKKQCVLDVLEINTADSPFNNNQQVMVYNINETYLDFLNLRMSNNTQNPAGYNENGLREAVIDYVKYPMFCWVPITDTNGTFCYPLCKEPICGQNRNCFKSYCANYEVNTVAKKYVFDFIFLHDDSYCVDTDNITIIKHNDTTKICDLESSQDTLFNTGTLIGFLLCLLCVGLMWLIARACGMKCVRDNPKYIADQLLRDKDQYLL